MTLSRLMCNCFGPFRRSINLLPKTKSKATVLALHGTYIGDSMILEKQSSAQ